MTDNKRFEIINTLMRINRKMATRGPKQGGPQFGRGQKMMIKEILNNPGISQDQLAEKLSIDKTTVAKTVKKLEEHKMIVRTRSVEDSRKYEITATGKALKMRDEIKEEFEKRSTVLFEGIEETELDNFGVTLKKIETNIEKNREETGMNRRRMTMILTRTIIHNPGITKEELIKKIEISENHMVKALEGMQERDIIKIINGGIHPTDKALERQKMIRKKRQGHPGRSGRRMV